MTTEIPADSIPDRRLLDDNEVSEFFNIPVRTLVRLRDLRPDVNRHGLPPGPRFVRLGRAIRYRALDIHDWIARQTVDPADALAAARGHTKRADNARKAKITT